MKEIVDVINEMAIWSVLIVYLVGLLFVLLVAVVYFLGYVYDSLLCELILKMGHWIGKKIPEIKRFKFIQRMWEKIQPKELYLRYETPLFTYCFSYTAIMFLSCHFPFTESINIIIASVVYLLCYFCGMKRRYRTNEVYYKEVLKNNSSFLSLSFLPITFLITIFGFLCTITGKDIVELFSNINVEPENVWLWINSIDISEEFSFGGIIILGILIVILLYILSLPIQIIAYFFISVITYFGKHRKAYKELFRVYKNILKQIFSEISGCYRNKDRSSQRPSFIKRYSRLLLIRIKHLIDMSKRGKIMKRIKEFYRENKVLCLCSLVAIGTILSYYITYDMPELIKGINKWYELLVTLSIGIITNLLFYIFQVYIPKKKEEQIAYEIVLGKLQGICRSLWENFLVVDYFFADTKKGNLALEKVIVFYKLIEEADKDSGWGGAFDFRVNLTKSIERMEKDILDILNDRVFSNCSKELVTVVANIQRSRFFSSFKRAQEDGFPGSVTYGDCEAEYDLLKKYLEELRRLVNPSKSYRIMELTEEEVAIWYQRVAQEVPSDYVIKEFVKIYI